MVLDMYAVSVLFAVNSRTVPLIADFFAISSGRARCSESRTEETPRGRFMAQGVQRSARHPESNNPSRKAIRSWLASSGEEGFALRRRESQIVFGVTDVSSSQLNMSFVESARADGRTQHLQNWREGEDNDTEPSKANARPIHYPSVPMERENRDEDEREDGDEEKKTKLVSSQPFHHNTQL